MTDTGGTEIDRPPVEPVAPGFAPLAPEPIPPAAGPPPQAAEQPASPPDPLLALPQRGGRLLGASFDILTTARADLRRASLYIGLILLLTVGPFAVLLFGLLSKGQDSLQVFNGSVELLAGLPEDVASLAGIALTVGIFVALAGFIIIVVEGQAVAIVLLAGRLAQRPVTVRAAVARSRVVFWRIVRGAFIVGIPVEVVELIVQYPLTKGLSQPSQGATLLATAVGTLVGWPFVYLGTGIVLGDVGAGEAARRSVGIVRARPWTALAIAAFAAIASYLTYFGIGAADDIVQRIVNTVGLDMSGGGLSLIVVGALVLVLVLAFGTLQFTVTAITLAPQVVAFLALTRYTGGLDKARAMDDGVALPPVGYPIPVAVAPGRFQWFQRRLIVSVAVGAVLTLLALARVAAL